MKGKGKKSLAVFLSASMFASLLPTDGIWAQEVGALGDSRILAKFTFDDEETGFQGGNAVAVRNGVTLSDEAVSGKAAYFSGKDYLEIKALDGSSLLTGKETLTVSYLRKHDGGTGWTFYAAPNANTQSYPNEHYVGVLDQNGSVLVERYNNEGARVPALTAKGDYSDWQMVTIVLDQTETTIYVNGIKQDSLENQFQLTDILGENSVLYLGKANWGSGEYLLGYLDDFVIYDGVLTDTEIASLYQEEQAAMAGKQIENQIKSVKASLEKTILNGNSSVSKVSKALAFPAEIEGIAMQYEISDTSLIAENGKILYQGTEKKEVTITVTGTYQGQTVIEEVFVMQVTNPLMADVEELVLVNAENVRGNLNLPEEGPNGAKITWVSSNPDVISDKAVSNAGYADTPAGVVTRQKQDVNVTLTATLSLDGEYQTKEFTAHVKAKKELEETTDYLFAYFTANTVAGENIYFASSQDGLNWTELNDREPVLTSTLGEKGLRDPYIMRSHEGDTFYMIATDLSIGRNGDWGRAQTEGSQAIMVWESEDLIHWTNQRMVTLTADIEAGCTWAPEAYYDEITGEYVVFWASKVKSDNYSLHRIFYSKTRDFQTFTEPQVWIDRKTAQTIDTTIVKGGDGWLYRISKNEGNATLEDGTKVTGATVYMEKAQSLFGEWTKVYAPTLEKIAGVEGPTCFQLNTDDSKQDTWCLLLDHYGSGGYRPYLTSDLTAEATEAVFTQPADYSLPSAPRHGTVLQVTRAEYQALMQKFGEQEEESVERELSENLVASYTLDEESLTSTESNAVIKDASGKGQDAVLKGNRASVVDGALYLPGGGANSDAAYVEIPGDVFEEKDTLSISLWLKNETGAGNYAAMSFGTKTKGFGGGTATAPVNYWLLNPAAPGGYFKSVWTNDNNTGSPWSTETATSKVKTGSDWAMYTTVITPTSIKGYYNGKLVCSSKKTKTTTDFGKELVAAIGRSGYGDIYYKGGVSDVKVYDLALTQAEIAQEYAETSLKKAKVSLTLSKLTDLTEDIWLPKEGMFGTTISWASSNENMISATGKVTRPTEDKSVPVTLTATIQLGEKTVTKEFEATVLGASEKTLFQEAMDRFELGVVRTEKDIKLPTSIDLAGTTIQWATSDASVMTETGLIHRPGVGAEDGKVILTAEVIYVGNDTLTAKKSFEVIVRAEDYGYVLAYTNPGEKSELGNSLHLAVKKEGEEFQLLNSNTGICFANNAGGSKSVNPNSLGGLFLFRKAEGTYGLLAANAGTSGKYIYAYDSLDLVNYFGEKKLPVDQEVTKVISCRYSEKEACYIITYLSGNASYKVATRDFETVVTGVDMELPASMGVTVMAAPKEVEPGNFLAIDYAEYNLILNKLGTIRNTGFAPVEVTADTAEALTMPEKVTATYSDGSTADYAVVWELENVDLSKAGTVEVKGYVKQTQYTNPLIEQRADPCILLGEDGYYYFTASYPMVGSGDKDGYDKVVLRRSETIEGLKDAEEITIWDCDDCATEHRYVWAPELHCIEGTYYVFYTSSVEKNNVWGIRPHVLRCNNAGDIMNPASWEAMGVMQAVESDTVSFTGFSLDMTLFENNGRYYVMWAQTDGYSSIFIAEVDKNAPWKCISKASKISIPEYSWEREVENVNEGPNVIQKNGKLFCTFSAAGTGVEYCIGLLTADENADLLDPATWVKQSYPVLTSADVPGEYGPGHNSFTVDEDGNDIFVYHARGQECYDKKCAWASDGSLYDPCRDARVKRVHWAADGTPILKMSYEDELLATEITAKVTINNASTPAVVTEIKTALGTWVSGSYSISDARVEDNTKRIRLTEALHVGTGNSYEAKISNPAFRMIVRKVQNGKTSTFYLCNKDRFVAEEGASYYVSVHNVYNNYKELDFAQYVALFEQGMGMDLVDVTEKAKQEITSIDAKLSLGQESRWISGTYALVTAKTEESRGRIRLAEALQITPNQKVTASITQNGKSEKAFRYIVRELDVTTQKANTFYLSDGESFVAKEGKEYYISVYNIWNNYKDIDFEKYVELTKAGLVFDLQ